MISSIAVCFLVVAAGSIAHGCVYQGSERINNEKWITDGFEYQCKILPTQTWVVEVTGCVWFYADNAVIPVGESMEFGDRDAKCYQDGETTRFEQKDKKSDFGGPLSGSDRACFRNGERHASDSNWQEGVFKFVCKTNSTGWMADIVACIYKPTDTSPEIEVMIGQVENTETMTLSCQKSNNRVNFEAVPKLSGKMMPSFRKDGFKPTKGKTIDLTGGIFGSVQTEPEPEAEANAGHDMPTKMMCTHYDENDNIARYSDGQTWRVGTFDYVCQMDGESKWMVKITGCYWPVEDRKLAIGEQVGTDYGSAE